MKLNPLFYKLASKEEFLIDLTNNNYSIDTIYNYGRDLSVFERFLEYKNIGFSNVNKQLISLYKGFLRSGEHLEILEILRAGQEKKEINDLVKETAYDKGENDTASSKGSRKNDNIDYSTRSNIRRQSFSKLSARSVNRMLSALRTYLKFLIEYDKQCPISPESIKLIKTERKEPQVADLDDLIRLIEAPENFEKDEFIKLRNRAMLELLFSTGMRISELVNLNIDQINSSGKIFIMGKGKKQRIAYLTQRATAHVNKYISKRDSNSPALFVSTKGQGKKTRKSRITPRYVQLKLKQYRQLLGIVVPVTPHGLRHGFATYLAEEGANPAAIQKLLGHESLQTTTKYVHASDKFAEESHKQYHPLALE